jgi:hypothetical protein
MEIGEIGTIADSSQKTFRFGIKEGSGRHHRRDREQASLSLLGSLARDFPCSR